MEDLYKKGLTNVEFRINIKDMVHLPRGNINTRITWRGRSQDRMELIKRCTFRTSIKKTWWRAS